MFRDLYAKCVLHHKAWLIVKLYFSLVLGLNYRQTTWVHASVTANDLTFMFKMECISNQKKKKRFRCFEVTGLLRANH